MDGNEFDTVVHHYNQAGEITHVNEYQLSVVAGSHYYFRKGKVYYNNNKEVPFELIPDFLKKQWKMKSKEEQAKLILQQKISERQKAQKSLEFATKELARLQAEEKAELTRVKSEQQALSKKLADEEKEAKEAYALALKNADKEASATSGPDEATKAESEGPSFGEALSSGDGSSEIPE